MANIISLSRLALAVAFVLADSPLLQVVLVAAAGLTDFVDGYLARHFNQRTRAGEIIDPITDKLFVATVVATLLARGRLSIESALLLLLRDFYNALAFLVIRVRKFPIRMKARFSGKVVTVLQLITIAAFILRPEQVRPFLLATIAVSVYSVFDYTRAGRRSLREARSTS
jgi:CDP-diacylglycerol--glycerol-3-phosphate 3-phosphatidyltransferase/cardiolipin synthase